MKMTSREKRLWIFVLGLIGCFAIYRFISWKSEAVQSGAKTLFSLSIAQQLLRSERNIVARHQGVKNELEGLHRQFLSDSRLEAAKLVLLERIEGLALANRLKVERKNVIDFGEGIIGVSLEGTALPEQIFGMMHQAALAEIGLAVKRLQLHRNLETRTLKYQLIITTKLVTAGGTA